MKKSLLIIAISSIFASCKKEHAEYRFTPKFHVGEEVQFKKSIEHDFADPGTRIWDIPQPLRIDSLYYNATWRDNWYFVTDNAGNKREASIDELSLQEWDGHLEK